jgi:hypothetical protein
MDIALISAIQASYASKDIDALKELMQKPKLEPDSILGSARLANQYIAMLYKPSFNDIRSIRAKYHVFLTQDYKTNLKLMGNEKEEEEPDLKDLLKLGFPNAFFEEKLRKYTVKIPVFDYTKELAYIRDKLLNLAWQLMFVKHDITAYRVFFKLSTSDKNFTYVSTKRLMFPSNAQIRQFFDEWEPKFSDIFEYEIYKDVVMITGVVEVSIEYYRKF